MCKLSTLVTHLMLSNLSSEKFECFSMALSMACIDGQQLPGKMTVLMKSVVGEGESELAHEENSGCRPNNFILLREA